MQPRIRVFDPYELWKRPAGSVAPWVTWVVLAATAVTIWAAAAGPRAVSGYLVEHANRFWFDNGLAIGVAVAVAVCVAVPGRLARIVHVATMLPVFHLATAMIAWALWERYRGAMPQADAWGTYARAFPAVPGAAVLGGVVVVLAWVHAATRRRVAAALHTVVMMTLLAFFLLGVWLPVAASLWAQSPDGWHVVGPPRWGGVTDLSARWWLPLAVIVPPFVAAWIGTLLFTWVPSVVARLRPAAPVAFVVILAVAVCARGGNDDGALLVYSNFIPSLLGAAVLAVSAIVALAGATVIARARTRRLFEGRTLTGTVAGATRPAPDVVARVEIASWLRGPRVVAESFRVVTPAATLPVPCGVEVLAPIPAVTTKLAVGESAALLVAGERVRLAGYVDPPADHPYRGVGAPVPGDDGVFVEPAGGEACGGFTGVALAVWRPCVAYLVIAATVALTAVLPA